MLFPRGIQRLILLSLTLLPLLLMRGAEGADAAVEGAASAWEAEALALAGLDAGPDWDGFGGGASVADTVLAGAERWVARTPGHKGAGRPARPAARGRAAAPRSDGPGSTAVAEASAPASRPIVGAVDQPDSALFHFASLQTPPAPRYRDGPAASFSGTVNVLSGYLELGAVDLATPARGMPLMSGRTYSSHDAVTNYQGPFGYGWNWSYGARMIANADQSVTLVEGNGRRATFALGGGSYTTPPGVNATLTTRTGGGWTLTRHDQAAWAFDGAGKLLSITDRNGNATTLTYDVFGRATQVTAPGGRQLGLIYDGISRRILRVGGPGGVMAVNFAYDGAGDLVSATDTTNRATRYTYDAAHRLLTVVDPAGVTVLQNTYDATGRVTAQIFGQETPAATAAYAYAADTLTVTDPRGTQIRYARDAAGRLARREVLDGATLLQRRDWAYNANDDVTSVTGPDGTVYAYTYDVRANLLSATADAGAGGLGLRTSFTYNAANDPLSVTDALNRTTTFTYDARGNRLTATDALNQTARWAYDQLGQVTSATDATNRTATYGYNQWGDRTTTTLPGGAAWTRELNSAGWLTRTADPLRTTMTYLRDNMGRLSQTLDANARSTTFAYDGAGRLSGVTDRNGLATGYGYDSRWRLTSVTNALNQATRYAYDGNGNRTRVTDALNRAWQSTYDRLNRPATTADPLNNTWTYTYDAAGNLAQLRRPDATVTRYAYDRVRRLTGVDLTNDGTLDIRYVLDAAGRRTSLADATGATTYAWDNADRLTGVTAPGTGTVGYEYDAAGRRAAITYPGGRRVAYGYNGRGELATVTDGPSGGVWTFAYDTAGRRTSLAFPNGVTTTYTYDALNRPTGVAHARGGTTLRATTYAYDFGGRRTGKAVTGGAGAGSTTYAYDNANRLTGVTYADGTAMGYAYDAAGQRITDTRNGTPATNTYDAAGRLTALGSTTYTYDANGRRTGRTAGGATTTYSYDALGRLSGISAPGLSASYTYNGDGLRVGKTVNGQTKPQAWDVVTGRPLTGSDLIYDDRGAALGAAEAGGVTQYQSDVTGSPEVLTDASGAVQGTTDYGVLGEVQASSGAQPAVEGGGAQRDAESGLVYEPGVGYYDPASGQAVSSYGENSPSGGYCNPSSGDCYAAGDGPPAPPPPAPASDDGGGCLDPGLRPPCGPPTGPVYPPTPQDEGGEGSDDGGTTFPKCGGGDGDSEPIDCGGGPVIGPRPRPGTALPSAASLSSAARAPYDYVRRGNTLEVNYTVAGRALDKHGNRPGSAFPPATGSVSERNARAHAIVDEIVNNPASSWGGRHHARFGQITEVRAPDGRGVRFTNSGQFIGFLEPGEP